MKDINTGHCNTGHRNTGHRNTGHCNTGDWNTGDRNTGDWNTGHRNTGHWNTGDWNTGHRNTGHRNTGDRNTGDWNTGDRNTGDWNTGDWNTGFFNTTTPDTINVFNKPCLLTEWRSSQKPSWIYQPQPTSWVSEVNMTGTEKVYHPTFHTCGGYLRKNDWFDEWRKAYKGATEEDVQMVRDLPNFDYAVFEEITGLDIRAKTNEPTCEGKTVEVDGIEYVLTRK